MEQHVCPHCQSHVQSKLLFDGHKLALSLMSSNVDHYPKIACPLCTTVLEGVSEYDRHWLKHEKNGIELKREKGPSQSSRLSDWKKEQLIVSFVSDCVTIAGYTYILSPDKVTDQEVRTEGVHWAEVLQCEMSGYGCKGRIFSSFVSRKERDGGSSTLNTSIIRNKTGHSHMPSLAMVEGGVEGSWGDKTVSLDGNEFTSMHVISNGSIFECKRSTTCTFSLFWVRDSIPDGRWYSTRQENHSCVQGEEVLANGKVCSGHAIHLKTETLCSAEAANEGLTKQGNGLGFRLKMIPTIDETCPAPIVRLHPYANQRSGAINQRPFTSIGRPRRNSITDLRKSSLRQSNMTEYMSTSSRDSSGFLSNLNLSKESSVFIPSLPFSSKRSESMESPARFKFRRTLSSATVTNEALGAPRTSGTEPTDIPPSTSFKLDELAVETKRYRAMMRRLPPTASFQHIVDGLQAIYSQLIRKPLLNNLNNEAGLRDELSNALTGLRLIAEREASLDLGRMARRTAFLENNKADVIEGQPTQDDICADGTTLDDFGVEARNELLGLDMVCEFLGNGSWLRSRIEGLLADAIIYGLLPSGFRAKIRILSADSKDVVTAQSIVNLLSEAKEVLFSGNDVFDHQL